MIKLIDISPSFGEKKFRMAVGIPNYQNSFFKHAALLILIAIVVPAIVAGILSTTNTPVAITPERNVDNVEGDKRMKEMKKMQQYK